jgi:hypothetical protein
VNKWDSDAQKFSASSSVRVWKGGRKHALVGCDGKPNKVLMDFCTGMHRNSQAHGELPFPHERIVGV